MLEDPAAETLGERLREARARVKLSQREVARRIWGRSERYRTVIGWEQDEHVPSPQHVQALAQVYGISATELRGKRGSRSLLLDINDKLERVLELLERQEKAWPSG